MLDAGAFAMSKDASANGFMPEARFETMADAGTGKRLPLGARVRVLPNHAGLTSTGGCGGYAVHAGDGRMLARWMRCDGW